MNCPVTITQGAYRITTDRDLLDVTAVHRYLSEESYWAKFIPFETVARSFEHSFVVGVLHSDEQVGYARLVTDYATFGYLADVYVLRAHRGTGLAKAMMNLLMSLPWVRGLRHILLGTADAHGLYAQFGFTTPKAPERLMQIITPNAYESRAAESLPDSNPSANES